MQYVRTHPLGPQSPHGPQSLVSPCTLSPESERKDVTVLELLYHHYTLEGVLRKPFKTIKRDSTIWVKYCHGQGNADSQGLVQQPGFASGSELLLETFKKKSFYHFILGQHNFSTLRKVRISHTTLHPLFSLVGA